MRFLDTPIRRVAGRTPRELVLVALGLGSIVAALVEHDHSWNIYAYAAATFLFAIRFFAGRVLFLSMLIGALTLQLALSLIPPHAAQLPIIGGTLVVAALLMSRDLVRRFDDEGRGLGPWRNYWRDLTVGQRRHIAWGMHLVGATGGLLHHTAYRLGDSYPVPTWLYLGVAGCAVVGFLYLWGRAIATPAAVVLGAAVAWKLSGDVVPAWNELAHQVPAAQPEVLVCAHFVLVGFATAIGAALLALPWAVRWARLALR